MPPFPRGALAVAAAISALAVAGPAEAIDMSLRPPFLPPVDGSGAAEALAHGGQGRDSIVAVEPGARAVATLERSHARRLGDTIWLVDADHSAAVIRRLSADGALRYAHGNDELRPSGLRSLLGDPLDPAPWWLPQIHANRVVAPSAGFPLTIVDDGIDTSHPEFAGRAITFLNQNAVVAADDFHGTMVSSVASAPANGVGMVGLYPLANLRSADVGTGRCADVLAAFEAVVAAGPSIINMSWGFSPPSCLALYEQILRAFAAGSLPVAATGNLRLHWSPPGVPGMWPHVLTVGSTDAEGNVSEFSNEGLGIDLGAPGEEIVGATPTFFDPSGYSELEGTSFSSALVSAAAAWVQTRRPMHVTQLAELLRVTARDTGRPGWDKDTGFGILDLGAALSRRAPRADPQEPNDDVNQVKAGAILKAVAPPLTHPGRGHASLRARLDRSEDPVDVYRVFVPPRRMIRLHVTPTSNVDLEVFRPNAQTCYYENRRRALAQGLIGGSYLHGRAAETFALENRTHRGEYVFACVYKPRDRVTTASYKLSVATARQPIGENGVLPRKGVS